jgi:hypothetical protein
MADDRSMEAILIPVPGGPSPAWQGPRPVPSVVPVVGVVQPTHVGAATSALIQRTLQRSDAHPKLVEIARHAQTAPTQYGGDVLIRHHNPNRDAELARDGRLPSQVWQANEARPGGLVEHLLGVHEWVGEVLEREHGHRPIAIGSTPSAPASSTAATRSTYRGAVVPGADKPPHTSREQGR